MPARASHVARIILFLFCDLVSGIGRCVNRKKRRALIAGTYLLLQPQERVRICEPVHEKGIKFHLLRPNCSVLCGVVIPFGNYSFQFVISSG